MIGTVIIVATMMLVKGLNAFREAYITSVDKCKQYNAELLEMMK